MMQRAKQTAKPMMTEGELDGTSKKSSEMVKKKKKKEKLEIWTSYV